MKKLLKYLAKLIVDQLVDRLGMAQLRIQLVKVQPGDLILVKYDYMMTAVQYAFVRSQWDEWLPDNKVAIVTGAEISVIHTPEDRTEKA